jgi:hypothetical protein
VRFGVGAASGEITAGYGGGRESRGFEGGRRGVVGKLELKGCGRVVIGLV